ncbi:MAG: rod-binding protein [Sphingomonas fennica]
MGEIPSLNATRIAAKAAAPAAAVSPELKAAAKQFEAIFIRQMMSSMRTAKLGDDILGSDAGNQFRDMADSKTADSLADKGSFGIADMLVKQLGARMKTAAPADASAAPDGGGGKAGG